MKALDTSTISMSAANELVMSGDLDDALRTALAVVDRDERDADAWHLIAKLLLHAGHKRQALAAAMNAARVARPDAHLSFTLGRIYRASGDIEQALLHYEQSLRLNSAHADVWVSYGVALRASHRLEEAIAAYRRALQLNPASAEARHNLGNALAASGRHSEAAAHLTSARETLGAEADRLQRTAESLWQEGRSSEALPHVREALRIAPEHAPLHIIAGELLVAESNLLWDQALWHFSEASRLAPDLAWPAVSGGRLAATQGLSDVAAAFLDRAQTLEPDDGRRLRRALLLDAVEESRESIAATRYRYDAALDQLAGEPLRIDAPERDPGTLTFLLAYHGQCNRELQSKLAGVLVRACPNLEWTAPHCRKRPGAGRRLRVGFLSAYLYGHSIGKTSRGFVHRLDRERFEVFVLSIGPFRKDAIAEYFRTGADHSIALEGSLQSLREQIAALQLDILFFQDIGMEPVSYYLAYARLAPVQCVSFGHPDTTGIPNMDYFVSNDRFEVPGADTHYSERLVQLRDLPTLAYYYRPQRSAAPKSRASFNLSEGRHVYLCPQTLFKLHPDFDTILESILERDPNGEVVLVRGYLNEWATRLAARFRRRIPAVADRIRFIEPLDQFGFFDLLAVADVVLDPVHFNGMNSSLEAFAVGAPVVTLPTDLQRGRHTQAMYRAMEITGAIASDAADYARIAVQIACEPDLAMDLRERILQRNAVLYENERVVAEFERFFLEAYERTV